ncbi:hypothetical protein [Oryza sativa Japonica Group]|uniref:Uncharacterized protein n=1 Tax=Oryza sativa subsp. japonica TaxID=39947 RepID=Q5VQH5_ORYSJ|nr:hypothetical protein [Oryza sativa Japonica Group]
MAAQQRQHMSMSASSSLRVSATAMSAVECTGTMATPSLLEGRFGRGGSSRRRSSLNAFDIISFSPATPAPAAEVELYRRGSRTRHPNFPPPPSPRCRIRDNSDRGDWQLSMPPQRRSALPSRRPSPPTAAHGFTHSLAALRSAIRCLGKLSALLADGKRKREIREREGEEERLERLADRKRKREIREIEGEEERLERE